jgi:hypothetical protein
MDEGRPLRWDDQHDLSFVESLCLDGRMNVQRSNEVDVLRISAEKKRG